MKKSLIIFISAVLVLTIILGMAGTALIKATYNSEIQTIQNTAGALIQEYPQAAATIMESLTDQEQSNKALGAETLAKYGYHTNLPLNGNQSYWQMLTIYYLVLFIFLLLIIFCGYKFAMANLNRRQKQEAEVLSILDQCLSGNFDFVNDNEQLKQLPNQGFADALTKLGASLQLKTELLNAEKDNTKTLVTNISHQLKTPISALKTCFSMYLEAEDETERREFADRCNRQIDKLQGLTEVLFNISRLESGVIQITPSPVRLSEIIIDAVNTVYHKSQQKEIEIITADFNDLILNLDKKWTAEAIANVLDNAIKYSPTGSQINIRISQLYSFVRIEIEDRGIGIPKAKQNKIFRRFFRGSEYAVQSSEGSGIGLYLARKITEEQGGTITVSSNPGEGSTFIIQLPL